MLPSRLEAVIFDAGGTLVTLDYPFIAQAARRNGEAVDAAALPRAEVRARRALDASARREAGVGGSDDTRRPDYFAELLAGAGVAEQRRAAIVAELEAAHRADNLWRLPQPDAADTLRGLRERGVRTAVVSNSDGRIHAVLSAARLDVHLELIVDSHLEGVEKPHPEIFRRALARLGLAAERAAYVGDIYSIDALGARAAGLAPVIIDPTDSYGALDCAKISRLAELLETVGPSHGGSA